MLTCARVAGFDVHMCVVFCCLLALSLHVIALSITHCVTCFVCRNARHDWELHRHTAHVTSLPPLFSSRRATSLQLLPFRQTRKDQLGINTSLSSTPPVQPRRLDRGSENLVGPIYSLLLARIRSSYLARMAQGDCPPPLSESLSADCQQTLWCRELYRHSFSALDTPWVE